VDNIDEEFNKIIDGLELEGPEQQYVRSVGAGVFHNTLPGWARTVIADIAGAVRTRAGDLVAPNVYEDATDQQAFSALATDGLREALASACRVVEDNVWEQETSAEALQAWIQVLNHAKFLVLDGYSPEDIAVMRARGDERYELVTFISAVQHEVLQALL
jgi:hypothetical protein